MAKDQSLDFGVDPDLDLDRGQILPLFQHGKKDMTLLDVNRIAQNIVGKCS